MSPNRHRNTHKKFKITPKTQKPTKRHKGATDWCKITAEKLKSSAHVHQNDKKKHKVTEKNRRQTQSFFQLRVLLLCRVCSVIAHQMNFIFNWCVLLCLPTADDQSSSFPPSNRDSNPLRNQSDADSSLMHPPLPPSFKQTWTGQRCHVIPALSHMLRTAVLLQFPYDAFKCCWDFIIYWDRLFLFCKCNKDNKTTRGQTLKFDSLNMKNRPETFS